MPCLYIYSPVFCLASFVVYLMFVCHIVYASIIKVVKIVTIGYQLDEHQPTFSACLSDYHITIMLLCIPLTPK